MVFAQNRFTMLPENKPYSVKKRKSFELLNLKKMLLCHMTTHQAFFEKPLLHFQEQTVFCQTIINCILGLLCVMFTEYVLQFSLLLENCNSFLVTINRDCKTPVCSHLTSFSRHEKLAFSGKGQLI